jgi:hypothetical protein
MSKRPVLYVVREGDAAACNIVPLRAAGRRDIAAPVRAAGTTWPRETSWRDLVRRLAKNHLKP